MSDVPPKQPVTGTESVRMNTIGGLPPMSGTTADPIPVTTATTGNEEFNASSALVTMHNAAQAGGDAFPVLKAFQDYLESERQRSRRRMMTLSCVFSVVIIIVVGGFMLMWFTTVKGMQSTNSQLLQAALSNAHTEPAPQPVVIQAPQPTAPTAEETAKIVADTVAKAQGEQATAFAKTLESLNLTISAMQKDNEQMKAELERRKEADEKAAKAAQVTVKHEQPKPATAVQPPKPAVVQQPQPATTVQQSKPAVAQQPQPATTVQQPKPAVVQQPQPATAVQQPKPAVVQQPQSAAVAQQPKQVAAQPQKPQELQIPKYDPPPPPDGYRADAMSIKTPGEKTPITWRVYVPEHN